MGSTLTSRSVEAGVEIPIPCLDASQIAGLPTKDIKELFAESARASASLAGLICLLGGELGRREGWRDEGASSLENWIVERTGVSVPTARAYAEVGRRLFDLPHMASALGEGSVSFDKVRAVAPLATPESDAELADQAAELSVRQLVELARSKRRPTAASGAADHARRSLRCNDALGTINARLPNELYNEVRNALEDAATQVPSDGETPYDQRMADALMLLVRSATTGTRPGKGEAASTVVAHVPLAALGEPGSASELFGELERGGLISAAVANELVCGSRIIVALDDEEGHTMYEGRAKRLASATQRREIWRRDRCCRFPGCTHVRFAIPHHIKSWKAEGGTTDLYNMALLCAYHHGLVHRKVWTMRGDANAELSFVGPSGRVMTSRPSPFWARVTTQGAT
jgi:Domain of unknown function (DUF222)